MVTRLLWSEHFLNLRRLSILGNCAHELIQFLIYWTYVFSNSPSHLPNFIKPEELISNMKIQYIKSPKSTIPGVHWLARFAAVEKEAPAPRDAFRVGGPTVPAFAPESPGTSSNCTVAGQTRRDAALPAAVLSSSVPGLWASWQTLLGDQSPVTRVRFLIRDSSSGTSLSSDFSIPFLAELSLVNRVLLPWYIEGIFRRIYNLNLKSNG